MTDKELKEIFPQVDFETICNVTLGRYETFAEFHGFREIIHSDVKASVTNFINAVNSFESKDEHFQKVNNMDFYFWKDFKNYSRDMYISRFIAKELVEKQL